MWNLDKICILLYFPVKIYKGIEVLNNIKNQLDSVDIYRTLHPSRAEYTFFSSAHGTFYSIDHMLDHKIGLNYFKGLTLSIKCIFNHSAMKLKIIAEGNLDNLEIHDKRKKHFSMTTKENRGK